MDGMTTSAAMTQQIKIRAVIFPEDNVYVAQGLEHDICTFGRTVEIAQRRFVRALVSTAAVCLEQQKECMQGIPRAPQKYWDMFDQAHVRVELERVDEPAPPPELRPTFRLLEAA
jgi:hypothetical protein